MDSKEKLDWNPDTVLPATAATVGRDGTENLDWDWDPDTILPATAATNVGIRMDGKEMGP